jgi:protein-S-isoprenylcysteine O-methyltransferase Ste14
MLSVAPMFDESHICGRHPVRHWPAPVAGLLVGPLLSAALIGLKAIRAVLEERTLIAELEGYADYANRVRYRLVPRL